MAWPDDSDSVVDADLQSLVDSVRAGAWLRAPLREVVVGFVAGFVAARPGASLHDIGSALRVLGLGPWTRRRFEGGGAA